MNETTKNPTNHSKTEFGVDAYEPYKEQQPSTLGVLDNASNIPNKKPVPPQQQSEVGRASKKNDINKNVLDKSVGPSNPWGFDTSQATQRLSESLFLKKASSVQGGSNGERPELRDETSRGFGAALGVAKPPEAPRNPQLKNEEPMEEAITNIKLKQTGEKQKYTWPLGGFAPGQKQNRQDIVSITYEEIGFFPRSFNRVFDRFLKQVFSDVENLVIQEYRFYRYLFLTTLKCMLILFFVPFFVNYLSKTYLVSPLTEYFWNTQQSEIFLNSYQQKRAFTELKDFEEKLYFESLINCGSKNHRFDDSSELTKRQNNVNQEFSESSKKQEINQNNSEAQTLQNVRPKSILDVVPLGLNSTSIKEKQNFENSTEKGDVKQGQSPPPLTETNISKTQGTWGTNVSISSSPLSFESGTTTIRSLVRNSETSDDSLRAQSERSSNQNIMGRQLGIPVDYNPTFSAVVSQNKTKLDDSFTIGENKSQFLPSGPLYFTTSKNNPIDDKFKAPEISAALDFQQVPQSALTTINNINPTIEIIQKTNRQDIFEQRLQEKTIELAFRYNNQSIEAITNFFADLISFITLCYLLIVLEIQVNITKSFLLEVFFGLDDGKKSLLILLITDLLVGYHSSNLWELFFEFLFNHYGLPESQTGIFLLVATLPVLLDVLFKYLIFRHLNRSSPATVATYHAIIE